MCTSTMFPDRINYIVNDYLPALLSVFLNIFLFIGVTPMLMMFRSIEYGFI